MSIQSICNKYGVKIVWGHTRGEHEEAEFSLGTTRLIIDSDGMSYREYISADNKYIRVPKESQEKLLFSIQYPHSRLFPAECIKELLENIRFSNGVIGYGDYSIGGDTYF